MPHFKKFIFFNFFFAINSFSQVNDNFVNATDVTGIINSCSTDALYTTAGATPDKFKGINWNNSGPKYNRWFKFTAPASGRINITVDIGGTKGSQRYTQLALWQSDGTTEVSSKHYTYTTEDVILGTIGLIPGATYYISVDAYSGHYGSFTLCLQDTIDYDFYEGAKDITSIINSCSTDALYTTAGATPDKFKGINWNNAGPLYNRWFKFTAPTSQINITVDIGGTKGSQRYTQLALWQSDGTTEVSSKHYTYTTEDVILGAIGLTPGATYYISVDAYSGHYGSFTLCLQAIGINFNGINNYIDFGNSFNLTASFSLEAWVLQKTTVATGTIISKRDFNSGNLRGYHLVLLSGKPNFSWYNNSGVVVLNITSPYAISNNIWHHIAATYDGSTAKIFIDGVQVVSGTPSSPPVAGIQNFLIGAMFDSSTPTNPKNYFNGYIDEVRVWNVGLTTQQIHEMMNQEIAQNGTNVKGKIIPLNISGGLLWANLKGYYPMNDYTASDKSGNSINGSPKNIITNELETAPLPYTTIRDGNWEDSSVSTPWNYGNSVWNLPNSVGVDGVTNVNWNIVKTDHNVNNMAGHTVLGLLINNTSRVTVKPSDSLTISSYLKLNGVLDLEGESQLIQGIGSIIDIISSGYLERDQQGTSDNFKYNYWGSPVGTMSTLQNNTDFTIATVLRDGTDPNNLKIIDFGSPYTYADGAVTSPIKLSAYWMYKFSNKAADDYNAWEHIGKDGILKAGEGYTMKGSNTNLTEQNYTFMGKPNNGTINVPISTGNQYLIGNPYPSAIDAKEFIRDNISVPTGNRTINVIDGNLYFWDHFGGGTHFLKSYEGGYAIFNLTGTTNAMASDSRINATFNTSTKIPPRFIPVAQGFFVQAASDLVGTDYIHFKNSQRVFKTENASISQFMKSTKTLKSNKKASADIFPKIYLSYSSPTGLHRQLLVGFIPNTTDGIDIGYDAINNETFPEDMSWKAKDANLVIQAVPTLDNKRILPLDIKVAVNGMAKISIDTLENIPEGTVLYIKDLLTGQSHNISQNPFKINLDVGTYSNRFELVFKTNSTLSVTENNLPKDMVIFIDNTDYELKIRKNNNVQIEEIKLYNYIGQQVEIWKNNFYKNNISLPLKMVTGVYVVQINTTKGEINKKIIIE